jgi:DNA-directed primase/polymerase protein
MFELQQAKEMVEVNSHPQCKLHHLLLFFCRMKIYTSSPTFVSSVCFPLNCILTAAQLRPFHAYPSFFFGGGEREELKYCLHSLCRLQQAWMLWCKETFEQHFSHDECRLFPLQQQLFAFVDEAAAQHGESVWQCFSVEFPSASEVSRLLSRHTVGDREPTLFQRVNTSSSAPGSVNVPRKRTREDYALLYGETPLSQQSRMFLAATLAGLRSILATIEARQLHLYEIIREGCPCHLYFDVEREGNYDGLRTAVCIDDEESNSSSVVVADDGAFVRVEDEMDGRKRTTFQCSTARYQELRRRAVETALRDVCGLDCPVEPDNEHTSEIFLRELEAFVRERFPSLATGPHNDGNEGSIFEEVWVLESVPLHGPATKFSQHYVVKLPHTMFDGTASVRVFVRQFVARLSDRAAHESHLHRSLFFHGPPAWYAVFDEFVPEYPRNTLPYLPRRCVVDEAVYSKNRMMRCLGSCKLGKSSVLRVRQHCVGGERRSPRSGITAASPPTLETFLATLISYSSPAGAARQLLHVEGETTTNNEGGGGGFRGEGIAVLSGTASDAASLLMGPAHWESIRPEMHDDDVVRQLVPQLQQAYSQISHAECSVLRPRRLHSRYVTFQVAGTRYCQHVRREHKSNNVYLVVDLENRTFVQKCFDPDCSSYRSPPFLLDQPPPRQ